MIDDLLESCQTTVYLLLCTLAEFVLWYMPSDADKKLLCSPRVYPCKSSVVKCSEGIRWRLRIVLILALPSFCIIKFPCSKKWFMDFYIQFPYVSCSNESHVHYAYRDESLTSAPSPISYAPWWCDTPWIKHGLFRSSYNNPCIYYYWW